MGKIKIMSILLACVGLLGGGLFSFTGSKGVERELRALVANYPKVKVERVGNSLFLMGEVDSLLEMGDLQSVATSLNETTEHVKTSLLTKLSVMGKEKIALVVEREINSPEIYAHFKQDRFYLEGIAENDFEADRAVEIARTYLATGVAWLEGRSPAKSAAALSSAPATLAAGARAPANYQLVDMLRVRPRH